MKNRPILFSSSMMEALLAGRKTQTRRVATQKHLAILDVMSDSYIKLRQGEWAEHCPYGQPGDRLWVRETWNALYPQPGDIPWYHHELDAEGRALAGAPTYIYRAGDDEHAPTADDIEAGFKWQPSIFMPRLASRLTLEITDVRVERVQDITEEDARAEGVEALPLFGNPEAYWHNYGGTAFAEDLLHPGQPGLLDSARESFESLWHSINGEGSWDVNPWVWVVEFNAVPS